MSCKSQADFESCLPGIGKVFQTPVVGIWSNGRLTEKASGHDAVRALRDHYQLGQFNTFWRSMLWPYLPVAFY
jgi:hypothetical protein